MRRRRKWLFSSSEFPIDSFLLGGFYDKIEIGIRDRRNSFRPRSGRWFRSGVLMRIDNAHLRPWVSIRVLLSQQPDYIIYPGVGFV
ncbi:unnamed protein product, partial [Mesorhabditis spiculigera]